MNLSGRPTKIVLPFAASGDKTLIPVASQIGITDGAASWTDGYPPLTRIPTTAGGIPPDGLETNGTIYTISALTRWYVAGGGFPYDSDFANNANISGYPKGARVLRADGTGYWLNTVDGNTNDPDGATPTGWVPDHTYGISDVTLTSANVTLTSVQYGRPVIRSAGTMTTSLNLIFPAIVGTWKFINNCGGSYNITAKTASGTGVAVAPGTVITLICDGVNIICPTQSVPVPVGTIIAWGTESAPSGYLPLEGATISRATYSALFALIGTTYGAGDGSTTFVLPDYRGRFLRGWAHGSANDPDRASRTGGDHVGSTQADIFASHFHGPGYAGYQYEMYKASGGSSKIDSGGSLLFDGVSYTAYTGGNETRPKNINVLYCIKY